MFFQANILLFISYRSALSRDTTAQFHRKYTCESAIADSTRDSFRVDVLRGNGVWSHFVHRYSWDWQIIVFGVFHSSISERHPFCKQTICFGVPPRHVSILPAHDGRSDSIFMHKIKWHLHGFQEFSFLVWYQRSYGAPIPCKVNINIQFSCSRSFVKRYY